VPVIVFVCVCQCRARDGSTNTSNSEQESDLLNLLIIHSIVVSRCIVRSRTHVYGIDASESHVLANYLAPLLLSQLNRTSRASARRLGQFASFAFAVALGNTLNYVVTFMC
jgi:hypothetical protein